MLLLVRSVMRQTRARIFHGNTHVGDKILSVFEPSTEVIRKGKAGKPNEFGKMIKLQEAENQIIVDYEVYARRPNDRDLLIPAIAVHQAKLGRVPRLVATDAGFYSARNETAAKAMGVKRVCIPNRSSRSPQRKREQKKRWFRNGQKWRTGCEGRISVVKRRNGLNRCRYKGHIGMQRWVCLQTQPTSSALRTSDQFHAGVKLRLHHRPPEAARANTTTATSLIRGRRWLRFRICTREG